MSSNVIRDFINTRIEKKNYQSINFDLALIREAGFWKILFTRIIFDIATPQPKKELLKNDNFVISKYSIPVGEFENFFQYLTSVYSGAMNIPVEFGKISDTLLYSIGDFKLCFAGNFPGSNIDFFGRHRTREIYGIDLPMYTINYNIHSSSLPHSYYDLDVISKEIPKRDVFDAINYHWKTKYQQHDISYRGCCIGMPVFDASISRCKIKDTKLIVGYDVNTTIVNDDELTLAVIAEAEGHEYRKNHKISGNEISIDIGFSPSRVDIKMYKDTEKLDQYNYYASQKNEEFKTAPIEIGDRLQQITRNISSEPEPSLSEIKQLLVDHLKKDAEFKNKMMLLLSQMYQRQEITLDVFDGLKGFLHEWFDPTKDHE